jgi:hypothetical protein
MCLPLHRPRINFLLAPMVQNIHRLITWWNFIDCWADRVLDLAGRRDLDRRRDSVRQISFRYCNDDSPRYSIKDNDSATHTHKLARMYPTDAERECDCLSCVVHLRHWP